jgi:N-acetylglutamate synthase-like GNAT family acetyltransferase
MKIEPLMHHRNLIPAIAALKFKQFGYLVPERCLEDFQQGLERQLHDKTIPMAFVAVEDGQFVGIFSLVMHDMETHPHLSPWLAGLVVHPDKRKQGIGAQLVAKAEAVAKELGYKRLYLFTVDKAAWYGKLGWKVIEQATFNGVPVTVMERQLGA